jgi:uncharacterized membrane protein
MDWLAILRWLHILGAAVLLGTGAGIAFFMVMAHRTKDPRLIAYTSRVVIIADYIFTTSAVIIQPITGWFLAKMIGWPVFEGWVVLSLILYVVTGAFWLPVVWMQHQMHRLAEMAWQTNSDLPAAYYKLFRLWFAFGIPAFFSVLAIVWLMTNRPVVNLW